MSGALQPPLLTPPQASALLDQVIFEQVLECIDLDKLYRVEQSVVLLVGDLDGLPEDQIAATARALLDSALHRLPAHLRSYLCASAYPPFGGCELCEAPDLPEIRRGMPRPVIRFDT
jgi:hypothetical protein